MTERDEFAAAALTGLLSFGWNLWPHAKVKKQAELAYEYADAMIAARITSIELEAPVKLHTKVKDDKK